MAASTRDLGRDFTALTGRAITFNNANAGTAARRLRDGETVDLMLNSADQVARLVADGLLDGMTVRELGRMLIGVAVREGAPRPDIATEAALRVAILAAPVIAHSAPATGATAGTHAARLIEWLGIAEAMRAHTGLTRRRRGGAGGRRRARRARRSSARCRTPRNLSRHRSGTSRRGRRTGMPRCPS